MQKLIKYRKVKKIFRRHWRDVYIPIYEDVGRGGTSDNVMKKELQRET